jgi:hypothetical protein
VKNDKAKAGHRACDRCFNREHGTEEDEKLFASNNQALISAISSITDGGDDEDEDDDDDKSANSLGSPMARATAQMKKNQEGLVRSVEASGKMKEGAEEYRSLTKQLVEETKKKNSKSSLW